MKKDGGRIQYGDQMSTVKCVLEQNCVVIDTVMW